MRVFILSLLCCLSLAFSEHKILNIVPFGDNNLKIVFDSEIAGLELKESKLNDGRVFVDIQSILVVGKKNFAFKDNSTATIAQNTPQIVRIVIKPTKDYALIKEKENLYVKFGVKDSKPPQAQSTQTDKNTKESPSKESLAKETLEPKPQTNSTSSSKKKKVIAIDPGHGGKDCGAMGVAKVCEKVIVLEVAKVLSTELKKRGYNVFMTRDKDTFIDLIKRTQLANDKNADLFVSIHANSIPKGKKSPSGIETYFLSNNRSERSLKVVEAENIGDIEITNYFSKQITLNIINTHRLIASSKLAVDIQGGMLESVRKKHKNTIDGGVRDGPFWVLAGALMPSILIEIGYVSHATEGKLLTRKDYQKLIAQGIADGIDEYFEKN
ncbi:N-acetylmuramoyl-L-alanine amidase family protein [Helicobacter sp. 23-1048]